MGTGKTSHTTHAMKLKSHPVSVLLGTRVGGYALALFPLVLPSSNQHTTQFIFLSLQGNLKPLGSPRIPPRGEGGV